MHLQHNYYSYFYLFIYFLLLLHDYSMTRNSLVGRSTEDVEYFLSLCKLVFGLQEFSSREIQALLTFDILRETNKWRLSSKTRNLSTRDIMLSSLIAKAPFPDLRRITVFPLPPPSPLLSSLFDSLNAVPCENTTTQRQLLSLVWEGKSRVGYLAECHAGHVKISVE